MLAPAGVIPRRWNINDSADIYGVRSWGGAYFSINDAGNLSVTPAGLEPANSGRPAIDMKELVDEVRRRGIGLPLLIRFSDILQHRIVELNEAFRRAIGEYGYKGLYKGVYPIKVNQDRYVVEQITKAGKPYHYGLEAGSKPELLAVLAMLDDEDALVICNGYKDEEYVETALLAHEDRPHHHPRGREVLRAAAHLRDRQAHGRQAAHRHARQAVHARLGPLGGLGRRSEQVRSHLRRDDRGGRVPEGARSPRFLRARALPPRLADQRDPLGEERDARGGALLRRAVQARRAAPLPRRGRRPGRRLRRLADRTSPRR